jgi:hypothetical protein
MDGVCFQSEKRLSERPKTFPGSNPRKPSSRVGGAVELRQGNNRRSVDGKKQPARTGAGGNQLFSTKTGAGAKAQKDYEVEDK